MLPSRFGGSGLDYQLAEEETASSATSMILRVSPTLGAIDEAALRATFRGAIGGHGPVDAYQVEILRNASTIEVRREAPLVTPDGKVLPLHLLRHAEHDRGRPTPSTTCRSP